MIADERTSPNVATAARTGRRQRDPPAAPGIDPDGLSTADTAAATLHRDEGMVALASEAVDIRARRRAADAVLAAGAALSAMADAMQELRDARLARPLSDAEQARFDDL